jgi:ribosomal-protein-serine acetyltransferase
VPDSGALPRVDPIPEFSLGDGISVRRVEDGDAQELDDVVAASRDYLAQWMPWAPGQTIDTTREFIRMAEQQVADNVGFQAVIVDGHRIIGGIGYHRIDWANRATSLGYWLAESAQGRGTMTRAVRALTAHAFHTWNLNRVEIQTGVGNARSRAIPERLGFLHEGVRRQAERVGDRWVDHDVFAMLAQDWPADA